MSDLVTYTRRGTVGVVTVDSPPVNALSVGVRKGLVDCIGQGLADDVEAIVLVCEGRTFIAGADIKEFGKPAQPPGLNEVLDAMEGSSKPVIAAIHGTALGGGLETALACHYRCAVPSAKLGLPEVLLGILPGAGGTQRLPRLIGVAKALDMITSGTPVGAAEALELGLVDEVVEGDLTEGAVEFAVRLIAEDRPLVKIRDMNDKFGEVDPGLFDKYRAQLAKRRRGFEAPQACVDAVEAATTMSFDEGIAMERETFVKLVSSDQSAAQRHIFFAERQAAKIDDVPKDTPTVKVVQTAVLGAGTMGGGIAMNLANAGIPVRIVETTQELLDKGISIVQKNYTRTMLKGRITQEDMDTRMALIEPTLNFDDIADADVVIEAVFEEMDLKKEIFKKLDATCKQGAVLATNTSTLNVNEIAAVTSRPERVVGMHFFSPANVMRLLEVVRGDKTDNETLATAMALGKQMNKVPVVVGVCDGFVGNRMLGPYGREAHFLLEEGALPQQIDKALYSGFGMAMGPIAMNDLAGLDIGWRIRRARKRPEGKRYSAVADKICELGRFGQKTSAGFYRYEEGDRTPIPDGEIEELIIRESELIGMERRDISDAEIIERCIYALVNEGARIIEEGFAQRASDIDVIYSYGYGFPIHRGGPMFYADTVGLKKVYDKVCEFHEQHGENWTPAPLLKKLAEEGGRFNG